MTRWMAVSLAVSMSGALALATPFAAAEPEQDPQASTVVLSGDDPELVESVAAELRAAGFDVIVVGPEPESVPEGTTVTVTRSGDAVVVHTKRPDGELDAEVLHPEKTGLSARDATALRTAEAIRSLVGAPGEKPEPPPEPEPLPEAPLPPPAPPPLSPPPAPPSVWAGPTADALAPELTELPVLRLGVFGGAGYSAPTPAAGFGVTLRGQLTRHLNLTGMMMGTHFLGETKADDALWEVYSARASVFISWEILGADNSWTPTLGGGLLGEVRIWEADELYSTDLPGLLYMPNPMDGVAASAGLLATAGISISRPWRFRFDIHTDIRSITIPIGGYGHETAAPELGPTIIGSIGIEHDLVTRKVRTHHASR